jgi:magnesium transporter
MIKAVVYKEENSEYIESLSKEGVENGIWLRVIGWQDASRLEDIGENFKIHELSIEDLVADHPPKYEYNENYSILILKTFSSANDLSSENVTQLNFIYGKNFIISFEQTEQPFITKHFEQISSGKSSPRVEEIMYELLDHIIDNYLEYAYDYQDQIDALENKVIEKADSYDLNLLFSMRREIHTFRKVVRPIADIIDKQHRPHNSIFTEDMLPYIKDLWDHASRTAAIADSLWETLTSLHAELLTLLQYKLSRTMNLMTAVSVIFLPMMMITGIYGMNFDYMPELHMKYAYFAVLAVILMVGIYMFFIFKIKDFLK